MIKKEKGTPAGQSGYCNPDCKLLHLSPDLLCESEEGDTDTVVIEEDIADFNWTNF